MIGSSTLLQVTTFTILLKKEISLHLIEIAQIILAQLPLLPKVESFTVIASSSPLSIPCMCVKQLQSSVFVTPWTAVHQASLSTGFFRQEYWSGLPFPSPYFTQLTSYKYCSLNEAVHLLDTGPLSYIFKLAIQSSKMKKKYGLCPKEIPCLPTAKALKLCCLGSNLNFFTYCPCNLMSLNFSFLTCEMGIITLTLVL